MVNLFLSFASNRRSWFHWSAFFVICVFPGQIERTITSYYMQKVKIWSIVCFNLDRHNSRIVENWKYQRKHGAVKLGKWQVWVCKSSPLVAMKQRINFLVYWKRIFLTLRSGFKPARFENLLTFREKIREQKLWKKITPWANSQSTEKKMRTM